MMYGGNQSTMRRTQRAVEGEKRVSKGDEYRIGQGKTHVIGSGDGDGILEWMPAHMQDLLVEVDLVRVRLLPHPCTGSGSRRPCPAALLLAVDGCGDANLLRLEGTLVGLQHNLNLLLGCGGVDHEVVVVGSRHDILAVTREYDLELIKD